MLIWGGGSKTILKFSIRKIRSHTPLFFFLQWLIKCLTIDVDDTQNHNTQNSKPHPPPFFGKVASLVRSLRW